MENSMDKEISISKNIKVKELIYEFVKIMDNIEEILVDDEETCEKIWEHMNNLGDIFGSKVSDSMPIFLLYVLIISIENEAHSLAELYANGDIDYEVYQYTMDRTVMKYVKHLLDDSTDIISYNSDPRGYILKIKSDIMKKHDFELEKDNGGNGIIAPLFI